METDLQSLTAMLARAGVVFTTEDNVVSVEAQTGPQNHGYSGFVAAFAFDASGALLSVEIAE